MASIIDTKKNEANSESNETVYDGIPSGFTWSSQATHITRLYRGIETALSRNGRGFDNLYIRKHGSSRWYIASSKGSKSTPDVLFWFFYDAYGFKSYVYVGWEKLKTEEFIKSTPNEQDSVLSSRRNPDVSIMWKKERSPDVIGSALLSMDRSVVDGAIDAVKSKLLKYAKDAEITERNLYRIATLIKQLTEIGTTAAKSLAKQLEDSFKENSLVTILKDMADENGRRAPRYIRALRRAGATWTELDSIEKSLRAGKQIRESERRVNQQSAVDNWYATMMRYIEDGHYELTAWCLIMIGRFDANLSKPPYRPFLDRHREDIVVSMLKAMAGGDADPANYSNKEQKEMLAGARKLGLTWPEIDSMEKSIYAGEPKRIGESDDAVGYPASAVMDRLAAGDKLGLYHGMQDLRYDGVRDSIIAGSLMRYDQEIANWMGKLLGGNPTSEQVKQIINFMMMTSGSPQDSWSHVKSEIESNRDIIIKHLLREYLDLTREQSWPALKMSKLKGRLHLIKDAGYHWPEIDSIEKSMDSRKNSAW